MRARISAALLVGAACVFPFAAQAQSADAGQGTPPTTDATPQADAAAPIQDGVSSGDIIVTAQRRAQSILTVPIAISAIGGDALVTKGITNSANLAVAVPNLQVSSPYGQTQPNFSLRGISVANEYNSNQASPIGVYIDDVYLASRTAHGMGLFDLDRVEVLRGPQGTLFGRNTTGGAINFITKGPSLHGNEGYAEAGYGNFNTFTAQAAVEATMVEDQLGVRIAGNYAKGDGQIRNVYPGGRDGNSQDTLQGRVSLRLRPGNGPLDIKLKVYGGRDQGTQAAIHGLGAFRTGLGFFETNENRIGLNRTEAYGGSATIAYEVSPTVVFTSITSRDGGKQNLQQAADGSPLDILDINWRSSFQQFSEEARFNYNGTRLKLVGGGFYGWDEVITDNRFNIGQAIAPTVNGGFFQHYRQVRRSYAVFAQGDYDLTERLSLTLGARYTWDRSQYRDGYAYLFAGDIGSPETPLATTVPCAGAPGTCPYNPNARFVLDGRNNALTGRVSLNYTFKGGTLVYASYNRGYRSGAFNGGGYTSSAGINYIAPERVNAYEVGLKGRYFNNALTLTMSGFYYDYINQQVQDTRPGPVSFLVNAPKAEVYGVEGEARWRLTPAVTINASAGYLHATYKELTLQNTRLDGNDLPFAPRFTAQGGVDLTLFKVGNNGLTVSPSVAYFSRQYFSPFNDINAVGTGQQNSELQQKGFAKVNLTAALTTGRFTIKAFATNLLNAKTYAYGLDLRGAGFPYNFLVPAAPRTFGGSVRVAF
ncbi:iron complex outermembrane receptor protein [Sphingomonas sp. SORGH_AS870]|uniref:TonB-dependent receptor n=1 Tax=Sphingomonas sp. SORGH_AS_0870 TaxID=3041801 RepID=UPI00286708FF|nr:TonB-dependent receptor [Sphingomonas sp. SORGH_AS_0870]MDR6146508.1 iron complex outermembrane receptor protein [Sphingomonas sp. SORGH_AS_0870]